MDDSVQYKQQRPTLSRSSCAARVLPGFVIRIAIKVSVNFRPIQFESALRIAASGARSFSSHIALFAMANENSKSLPVIGFLTVVANADVGVCGGYLLLSQHGRPLEVHCTAPVKPNRAQEVLYGPTLMPYLYGEQVGQALFTAAAQKPAVVCTDVEDVLALREFVSVPVVMIGAKEQFEPSGSTSFHRFDRAHASSASKNRLIHFKVDDQQLAVPANRETDCSQATEHLSRFVDGIDFTEPFGRIHEAIEEALRGAK